MTKLDRPFVKAYILLAIGRNLKSLWKSKILYGKARFFEQVLAVFLAEFPVNITRFCIYFTNIHFCFTAYVSPLQLIMYGMISVFLYNALSFAVLMYTVLFHVENDVELQNFLMELNM